MKENTHYDGCWEDHPECARIHLRAALQEIALMEPVYKAAMEWYNDNSPLWYRCPELENLQAYCARSRLAMR